MALSTCVKCGEHRFELHEAEPGKANYKFWYLQCTSCGGVAGLTEFINAGAVLKRMEEEMKTVKSELKTVKSALNDVQQTAHLIQSRLR